MRVARWLLRALLIVFTLIVAATAAAVIVSQTAWFRTWLRGFIVREANGYLNGTVSIQRLGGNLFFGVEMENIGIAMDGTEVVGVRALGLDYNVFEMITRGVTIDRITLDKPTVYLRREGSGWQIAKLVKPRSQGANRKGPGRPIAIHDIGISDGSVRIEGPVGTSGIVVPKRIDRLDARLSCKYAPVDYAIEIGHASFRASDPKLALHALSGGIALRGNDVAIDHVSLRTAESSVSVEGEVQQYTTRPVFQLRVSSDKLSIPEVARIVPALKGVDMQPRFALDVGGPLTRLGVTLDAQSSAGGVDGRVLADLVAPVPSVAGTIAIRHLDLAPLVGRPADSSDITAEIRGDLAGGSLLNLASLHGAVDISAPRIAAAGYDAREVTAGARIDGRRIGLRAAAAAYGARATAAGHLLLPARTGEATDYDVRGTLRRLDLRRLPRSLKLPPATTDVNADYHMSGSLAPAATGPGRYAPHATSRDARPTFVSMLRLAGGVRLLDSSVPGARIAAGSRAGFSIERGRVAYDADASVSGVDLQRVGRAFRLGALESDLYRSEINAHVTAKGSGTALKTMNVAATGTLTDSTVIGSRVPRFSFDARIAGDTAHVAASGAFSRLDPGALAGKPAMNDQVGGSVTLDATVRRFTAGLTPDRVQASAKLDLTPSTVGGLEITAANVEADYHDDLAVIRTLDVEGRDLNAKAAGTVALGSAGHSHLTLHVDTSSLDRLGRLTGTPISGIAKLDATITGNRSDLEATGTFSGSHLAYGSYKVMELSTDYDVRLPRLKALDADVSATSKASFVIVGGQTISELTARTDYGHQQVRFDLSAKQPKRSLVAGGAVLLHPDHDELRLQHLALQSNGVDLHLAPDAHPTMRYGGNAITVSDLRFVTGQSASQIAAEGSFGRPGDRLTVTLGHFDLATIDALMLRSPRLSGFADGTATLAGSKQAPAVAANVQVTQGGFRQFHYQTLSVKADYAGTGVTVDSRLQQNPTTWLRAKGYLPVALFNANAPAAGGSANRIDFHVDSSPIDAGLVQGFTNSVTNVTGTLQAKIDVTGTASNPQPDGDITIRDASFAVAPTGVKYSRLDGDITLRPDRVHIARLQLLDDDRKPLTITGDLAVQEKRLGGVNVAVKADDFKVIDNRMGHVRINSNLRIAGELQYPRIEGDLGVSTGTINLDPILAAASGGAYSTREVEYETTAALAAPEPSPASNSPSRAAASDAASRQPWVTGGNVPPAPAASTGSIFDPLEMYVHVTVPNDLVIKARNLTVGASPIGLGAINVTLGGNMYVSKQPWDQARLIGTVRTIRGFYDFQSRRFAILRGGTVRFEGLDRLDPALDIKAQRAIQGVQANVAVRGTLDKPQIALTSVPPLDQGDILALIVFNEPLNQLGEGQQVSLAQRAESMATGVVAGRLANAIGNALGLDEFEINMAPETGGGPQVTLGQQIGQNLYVMVQQGVGDLGVTNVIVEYDLTNWLRLRSNVMQGSAVPQSVFGGLQDSGADMIFFFSF